MIDLALLVQSTIVMLFASILQATVGYGFGLIAVPLLLIINTQFVPAPLIIASLFLMGLVAAQNRFALTGHRIWPLILGLVIGAPVGAHLFAILDRNLFIYLVSSAVALGLFVSFLHITVPINSTSQLLSGIASNVLGTATGLGGAPIALLYQHESGAQIRAVLSSTFFVGGALSLLALWWAGFLTTSTLFLSAYLLPGIFMGALLGKLLSPRIDAGFSRAAILIISTIGLLYLILGV